MCLLLLCLLPGCLGRLAADDRALQRRRLDSRDAWQTDPPWLPTAVRHPLDPTRVRTQGRVEWRGPGRPPGSDAASDGVTLTWAGSALVARFTGPALALDLQAWGEVHLDITVDGHASLLSPPDGPHRRYALSGLREGPHTLVVYKSTEGRAGHVDLRALYLPPGRLLLPPPPPPARRLEFIGDSMTVGACVLSDGREIWDRRDTHCHGLSFAARTARALSAEHRAIAVSGLGVSHSLGPSTAAGIPPRAVQLYDRLRPDPGSPPDDDPTWQPDAVIVLLGHNDVLYAGRTRTPFAPRFADDYVDLVRALRRRYPRSLIVCTTGGMYQSRALALRQAWADALKRLQATDPRIVSHRFSAWSFLHPRAHTQARLADELTRLLAAQLGWSVTPADVAPPGATSDDQ